jgi:hypothetical protein
MGFDQPNMDKHWDLQKLGFKKKNRCYPQRSEVFDPKNED